MEGVNVNYRLSAKQRDRISEFFMDVAKLVIASVFVPFFVPGAGGGSVTLPALIGGTLLTMVFFGVGVKLAASTRI